MVKKGHHTDKSDTPITGLLMPSRTSYGIRPLHGPSSAIRRQIRYQHGPPSTTHRPSPKRQTSRRHHARRLTQSICISMICGAKPVRAGWRAVCLYTRSAIGWATRISAKRRSIWWARCRRSTMQWRGLRRSGWLCNKLQGGPEQGARRGHQRPQGGTKNPTKMRLAGLFL